MKQSKWGKNTEQALCDPGSAGEDVPVHLEGVFILCGRGLPGRLGIWDGGSRGEACLWTVS